jgi:MSHA biogenesis protein MshL
MTCHRDPTRSRPLAVLAIAAALGLAPSADQGPSPPSSQLPPLAVTQVEERPRGLDLDGRTLSLRTADPLGIRDVLILLFRDTDFSIVPDPDVEGAFTGELKNVTLRQALELVLHPLRLDYAVQGQSIRVFPRRVDTRLFDVDYVLTRRSAHRALGASTSVDGRTSSAGGPAAADSAIGSGSSTAITSADEGDVFDELASGIRTLLSNDGRFNLDRKAALLQVSDYPEQLDRISLYLDAVRGRVLRQVLIEARVLEVVLSEAFAAGINWPLVFGDAGGPGPASGTGPMFDARVQDARALIKALGAQGAVTVLSSPRVVAMNNEPALMRVGTQEVYFLTTARVDSETGRTLQTTVTPQAVTEGIVLSVTPQIGADGAINMSITPSVTERTGVTTSRFGDTMPVLSVRETDTLVRVHEGQTIVLAGLMQQRSPAPRAQGAGRRPSGDAREGRRSDLVILLTPTILTPGRVAAATAGERERLEAQQSVLAGAGSRGGKR